MIEQNDITQLSVPNNNALKLLDAFSKFKNATFNTTLDEKIEFNSLETVQAYIETLEEIRIQKTSILTLFEELRDPIQEKKKVAREKARNYLSKLQQSKDRKKDILTLLNYLSAQEKKVINAQLEASSQVGMHAIKNNSAAQLETLSQCISECTDEVKLVEEKKEQFVKILEILCHTRTTHVNEAEKYIRELSVIKDQKEEILTLLEQIRSSQKSFGNEAYATLRESMQSLKEKKESMESIKNQVDATKKTKDICKLQLQEFTEKNEAFAKTYVMLQENLEKIQITLDQANTTSDTSLQEQLNQANSELSHCRVMFEDIEEKIKQHKKLLRSAKKNLSKFLEIYQTLEEEVRTLDKTCFPYVIEVLFGQDGPLENYDISRKDEKGRGIFHYIMEKEVAVIKTFVRIKTDSLKEITSEIIDNQNQTPINYAEKSKHSEKECQEITKLYTGVLGKSVQERNNSIYSYITQRKLRTNGSYTKRKSDETLVVRTSDSADSFVEQLQKEQSNRVGQFAQSSNLIGHRIVEHTNSVSEIITFLEKIADCDLLVKYVDCDSYHPFHNTSIALQINTVHENSTRFKDSAAISQPTHSTRSFFGQRQERCLDDKTSEKCYYPPIIVLNQ